MEDKEIVYFVKDGQMMSGWIIASLVFDIDEGSKQYLDGFFDTDQHQGLLYPVISRYVNRPGKWHFVSGHRLVHDDDIYASKEEAADAYRDFLMSNN